jgi:sugar lactone lactonase YvrE
MIDGKNAKHSLQSFLVVVPIMALCATVSWAVPASASPSAGGTLSVVAGTGFSGSPAPGPATSSDLSGPAAVAVDSSGNLYIADFGNNVVEEVTPGGVLSIVAGTGTGGAPTPGPATSSNLYSPAGVAVDSAGNLYIADMFNNRVEKVTSGGVLSIVAGTGTGGVPTPGPATSSDLYAPSGVAVDSAGNLYIADLNNNLVEKVTSGGVLSIVAGSGNVGRPTPGPATASALYYPFSVAIDSAGNLYIADSSNDVVEKVTSGGVLSIVAGTGTGGAPTPGLATSSDLSDPQGVAVDSAGNLYIADANNSVIEQVTPFGVLSIVAGTGTFGPPTPGPAAASALNFPYGVAVDSSGNLYIADFGNNVVEEVTTSWTVPGPPTTVTATAGNAQANVTWSAPTSDGGARITSFSVQYSTDGGASWTTASMCTGLATSCTVTGLTNGSSYLFRVLATNVIGTGDPSTSSAVTLTALAATGSNLATLLGASGVLGLCGVVIGATSRRRRSIS